MECTFLYGRLLLSSLKNMNNTVYGGAFFLSYDLGPPPASEYVAYVAWQASTTNRVVVPARQAGN
jgi:hypothetical protein